MAGLPGRGGLRLPAPFTPTFSPEELPEVPIRRDSKTDPLLIEVIEAAGFASSRSEARRLIRQGGVRLDEGRVEDAEARVAAGQHLLQVGKRRFARISVG